MGSLYRIGVSGCIIVVERKGGGDGRLASEMIESSIRVGG